MQKCTVSWTAGWHLPVHNHSETLVLFWHFIPLLDTVHLEKRLKMIKKNKQWYIFTIKAFLVMCGDGWLDHNLSHPSSRKLLKVTLVCQQPQAGSVDGLKIQALVTTRPVHNGGPVSGPFVHCSRAGWLANGLGTSRVSFETGLGGRVALGGMCVVWGWGGGCLRPFLMAEGQVA